MPSSTNVGSIHYDLELNTRKFDQSASGVKSKLGGISSTFKAVASSVAVGAAAFTAGGYAIKRGLIDPAIDLNESLNAVQKTFGSASKKVLEFGKTADRTSGLSKAAFNSAVVPIGSMLRNMGYDADKAADSSIKLASRAADLASVFNTDLNEALTAIQAGLRGEADPLERFGVGLNQTAVKAYALREGIIKTGEEMGPAAQATARLGLFFEQTTRYAGDFVDTSDEAANRSRILQARFENLRASVGMKLMPVFNDLLGLLSRLLDRLSGLSQNLDAVGSKAATYVAPVIADMKMRFDDLRTSLENIWRIFQEKVLPKLSQLWQTLSVNLIPSLRELWQDTLKPLAGFLGTAFVIALVASIDSINRMSSAIAAGISLFNTARDKVGQLLQKYREMTANIPTWVKIAFGTIGNIFTKQVAITDALIRNIEKIVEVAKSAKDSVDELVNKVPGGLASKGKSLFKSLNPAGQIESLTGWNISPFADGVRNFRGGMALVGERGPELLNLPRGTDVYKNSDTGKMLGATNNSSVNFYGNITITDRPTADYWFSRMNRNQHLQGLGVGGR